MISHGNGPQVGLLALQGSAYTEVDTVPARPARRADRGHDRLPDPAGARQRAAVREAARVAADADRGRPRRPGVRQPDEADRADLRPRPTRSGSRRRRAGRSSPTATASAASCPRRCRSGSSGSSRSSGCSSSGCVVICAGGGGIPVMYTDEPGARRPAARRRRGRDRQGPRERAARQATCARTRSRSSPTSTPSTTDWGTPEQRAIRRATPGGARRDGVRRRLDGAEGARRLLVRRGDGRPRRDRLDRATRPRSSAARPGTIVTRDADGPRARARSHERAGRRRTPEPARRAGSRSRRRTRSCSR